MNIVFGKQKCFVVLCDFRVSVVKSFWLLLIFLSFLQGCTLLFVAKGGTHYAEKKAPTRPSSPSLKNQLAKAVVLKYKVREGDTFKSIAVIYYGKTSKAQKVAEANGLTLESPLKNGMVLKITDPVNFPNPKDFAENKTEKISAKKEEGVGPVSHRDMTPENITLVSRPRVNKSFGPGEKLIFQVKALGMVGGYGTLEIGEPANVKGRSCLPLTARARTAFPFSALFQVKDIQTSFFDRVDFIPWKFENDVLEGKHQAQNLELFDQVRHKVTRTQAGKTPEEVDAAPFTQDIISCFYYFRLLPLVVGKNYSIPTQAEGRNYNLIVEVIRRERITTSTGTYDCLLVKPHVRYATVFRNTDEIDIWLTDDARHMPVLVRSAIFIGHVEAVLFDATLPRLEKEGASREP